MLKEKYLLILVIFSKYLEKTNKPIFFHFFKKFFYKFFLIFYLIFIILYNKKIIAIVVISSKYLETN